MAKDKVELSISYQSMWLLFDLLNNQRLAKAPLGVIADMMDARAKLDPSELKEAKDSDMYKLSFTKNQFNHLYRIATSENLEWPINEHSAKLFKSLESAKKSVGETETA